MKPKPLPPHGTIAIIAPSSCGKPDEAGLNILEQRGYKTLVHPQNDFVDNQSAGPAAQRAAALMDVFSNPCVDAVMCARGGNRSMHLLPMLDYAAIAMSPKPLIGFSDGTALLNGLYAQTGVTGYHGPTLSRVSKATLPELDQMFDCLNGEPHGLNWNDAQTLRGGRAHGPLIGGNLSVFAALAGTPFMPDTKGAIIFLEDIGDQLSRYDRMLAQLRLCGIFENASAIIFGKLIVDGDSSVTPFGFSVDDIIAEHTGHLDIPVITNAPFGHAGPLCTLPVGGMAALDADAKTLTLE